MKSFNRAPTSSPRVQVHVTGKMVRKWLGCQSTDTKTCVCGVVLVQTAAGLAAGSGWQRRGSGIRGQTLLTGTFSGSGSHYKSPLKCFERETKMLTTFGPTESMI